jgi:hypothetical protein
MQRMHPDCQVKPSDGNVIRPIGHDDAGSIELECTPVVCRVPARASHSRATLYVVFTGRIALDSERHAGQLMTRSYGTNFAYFDVDDATAAHVLGGHYDFAFSDRAHPRAHMQLRSHAEFYGEAQSQFRSLIDIPLASDLMNQIFSRARPPTAQMDFVSFLLQVCADHLVDEKSSTGVVSMFEGLAASCAPIRGYNATLDAHCNCHRAPHWYPPTPSELA